MNHDMSFKVIQTTIPIGILFEYIDMRLFK